MPFLGINFPYTWEDLTVSSIVCDYITASDITSLTRYINVYIYLFLLFRQNVNVRSTSSVKFLEAIACYKY